MIVGCEMNDDSVIPNGIPLAALTAFDDKKNRWLIKKMLVDSDEKDYVEYMGLKDNWVFEDPSFPRTEPFETPKRFIFKGD